MNTPTATKPAILAKARTTGYYVWVGAEKRWFRSEERARAFFARRCNQYGVAAVQLQDVATGDAIAGGR